MIPVDPWEKYNISPEPSPGEFGDSIVDALSSGGSGTHVQISGNSFNLPGMAPEPYFEIDPDPETAKRIRKERDKARALKRTAWWKQQLQKGCCHYCGNQFRPDQLSMDHVVPLARGGKSTKGNTVPACHECNRKKKLETPAEAVLRKLSEN